MLPQHGRAACGITPLIEKRVCVPVEPAFKTREREQRAAAPSAREGSAARGPGATRIAAKMHPALLVLLRVVCGLEIVIFITVS